MYMKNSFIFLLTLTLFLLACSSDSDDMSIDPIIGTWEGPSVQKDLGSIQMRIVISSLDIDKKGGSLTSSFKDTGDCNSDLFYCDPFSCASDWIYKGKSGSAYLFEDVALPGSECTGRADIRLSFSGSDQLVGTATFDLDPSDLVEIETNQITLNRVN